MFYDLTRPHVPLGHTYSIGCQMESFTAVMISATCHIKFTFWCVAKNFREIELFLNSLDVKNKAILRLANKLPQWLCIELAACFLQRTEPQIKASVFHSSRPFLQNTPSRHNVFTLLYQLATSLRRYSTNVNTRGDLIQKMHTMASNDCHLLLLSLVLDRRIWCLLCK